ncbi:hypothetical protein SLEP1_g58772, partial [Rubroshorea leprosula]
MKKETNVDGEDGFAILGLQSHYNQSSPLMALPANASGACENLCKELLFVTQ